GVVLSQVVPGVADGPTGVLLLHHAEEVRGVADLRLDLLLAVAEVVVGDDRHDDATLVAGAKLEGGTAVVTLVLRAPALSVAPLAVGGLVDMGETEFLLGQGGQV